MLPPKQQTGGAAACRLFVCNVRVGGGLRGERQVQISLDKWLGGSVTSSALISCRKACQLMAASPAPQEENHKPRSQRGLIRLRSGLICLQVQMIADDHQEVSQCATVRQSRCAG